jgi:AraC-like DNA-binding protein
MWQTIRTSSLSRHSHKEPYAALVLSGGYEEAGDYGRFHVKAGCVVFHDRFDAHSNRFSNPEVAILNLRLQETCSYTPGIAYVPDPDAVVQTAEKNRIEAVELLLTMATNRKLACADWPDELAAALIRHPALKLSEWAQMKMLAPWTVSRGFVQVFGITPEAFRLRVRTRHAWKLLENTEQPLAQIAAHSGFSDQSHMTRSVRQLTGAAPHLWRRNAANRFKTCDA